MTVLNENYWKTILLFSYLQILIYFFKYLFKNTHEYSTYINRIFRIIEISLKYIAS